MCIPPKKQQQLTSLMIFWKIHQTTKPSCFSKSAFFKQKNTKQKTSAGKKPRPCNNVCSATSHPKPPRRVNPVNPRWARCPPRGRPHPIRRCPGSTPKKTGDLGKMVFLLLCVCFFLVWCFFFQGCKIAVFFFLNSMEMADSCCWSILWRVH